VFHGFLRGAAAGLGTDDGTFPDLSDGLCDTLSEDDELVLFPSVDAVVLLLIKPILDVIALGRDCDSFSSRIGILIWFVLGRLDTVMDVPAAAISANDSFFFVVVVA
jgi:hypothetical protein